MQKLMIYVEEAQYKKLKRQAEAERRSMSEVIRYALDEYLKSAVKRVKAVKP
ncbi:MAG: ribbon-helix-helix protein, CopG family [Deltaproteobacteria bacterium]|nr:ribbon-helix-helix protein, CopG family [Deltaproteobacteria bacterium]MDZ4346274.1 ribbon-helix-helix protein, CopG family [Candidatus Binatia bacterium]